MEKPGHDASFVDGFKTRFRVDVLQDDDEELEVEMVGMDGPIVNALRRILLSEVPSVAVCACLTVPCR